MVTLQMTEHTDSATRPSIQRLPGQIQPLGDFIPAPAAWAALREFLVCVPSHWLTPRRQGHMSSCTTQGPSTELGMAGWPLGSQGMLLKQEACQDSTEPHSVSIAPRTNMAKSETKPLGRFPVIPSKSS